MPVWAVQSPFTDEKTRPWEAGVMLEAIWVGGKTELCRDSKATGNLREILPGPRLLELDLHPCN